MAKVNVYLGLNDKDTGLMKNSIDINRKILHGVLTAIGYDAYSLQIIDGVFTHKDGRVVIEKTFLITLLYDGVEFSPSLELDMLIDELKLTFNQECIAVEVIESKVQFI